MITRLIEKLKFKKKKPIVIEIKKKEDVRKHTPKDFILDKPNQNEEQEKLKARLEFVKNMLSSGVHGNLKSNINNVIESLMFNGSKMAMDSKEEKENKIKIESMEAIKKSLSFAMDDNAQGFQGGNFSFCGIPVQQYNWYLNQNFIGWTNCALMAQHWLISKACLMPAEDCIRRGYDYVSDDGEDIDPEILKELKKIDEEVRLNYQMVNIIQFGRVFGIRVAVFIVDSEDEDYYYEPFNIDGIKPGSYKGITQIDPYWMSPILDIQSSGAPMSTHFYEPTWWNITGKMVHRSHLVIYRTEEVADILKSSYVYGGIPIPQKMYTAVYQAEMISSELPYLIKTKRSRILKTDTDEMIANQQDFNKRMSIANAIWDNSGTLVIDKINEEMEQIDTQLTDCEDVCLLMYQLCASRCGVIFSRLFETTPKGWQSTGNYEENVYRDTLETMRHIALIPLAKRHHQLAMKSIIEPKFNTNIEIDVQFKPLDALSAKELAEINKLIADTDAVLNQSGAISGQDIRVRLAKDPESGYMGIDEEVPEDEFNLLNQNNEENDNEQENN